MVIPNLKECLRGGVAAASCLVLIAACSGGTGVAAPSPSPSSPVTGWHRLSELPQLAGGALRYVTAAGSMFMAVGATGVRGPGAAWTSIDGVSWQATNGTVALAGIPLDSVVAGGPGFVAFGTDCSGSGGECGPTIEITFDGSSWTRKGALVDTLGRDHGAPVRFAKIGALLVGIGSEQVGNANPIVYSGRVWTSADEVGWRLEPDAAVFAHAQINDVAAGAVGLVAVGAVDSASELGTDAAVWTSVDGLSWSRLPSSAGFADAAIYAVIAVGQGYLAVGAGANGAAVWTSADGRSWIRMPDDPALHDAAMFGVAATSSGFTAVGYGHDSATIWTSPTGASWSRIPDGPAFAKAQALAIAVKASTVVVVGGANGEAPPAPIIWSDR